MTTPEPATTLPVTLEACHALIQQQDATLQQLLTRLAELEERLKLDSRTSSKPPSSDGPGAGKRQRSASANPRGAQPGHKGSYRVPLPTAQLDRIVDCPPSLACDCGGVVIVDGRKTRHHQVFDLPPIQPIATEYRCLRGVCTRCGQKRHGALPAGVPSGQLGPRAVALIGTLAGQYHLSQGKIRDLLAGVFGLRFSLGTVSSAHGQVAEALAAPMAEVHTALQQAPVRHMDETSHHSHGHLMWLWALVGDWGASFSIQPSRGKLAAQAVLGDNPAGVLVSDRYAGYHWVDPHRRQVCWAHLLRDFARIAGRSGETGRLGSRLLQGGYVLFRWREQGKSAAAFAPLQKRLKRQLQVGTEPGGCRKTAGTCRNLLALWSALWRFLDDPRIPPTNNLAERALRGVVLRRKISYVTRSGRGLRFVERAFAAAYTCRRQGIELFEFLQRAMNAKLGNIPAPSLVPAAG